MLSVESDRAPFFQGEDPLQFAGAELPLRDLNGAKRESAVLCVLVILPELADELTNVCTLLSRTSPICSFFTTSPGNLPEMTR